MLPEAWVVVDTPYLEGCLRAKCMNNPLYDLVLENIDCARYAGEPDSNWNSRAAFVAPPLGDRETLERRDSGEGATAMLKEQSSCSAFESGMSQANPVVMSAQSRDQAPFRNSG